MEDSLEHTEPLAFHAFQDSHRRRSPRFNTDRNFAPNRASQLLLSTLRGRLAGSGAQRSSIDAGNALVKAIVIQERYPTALLARGRSWLVTKHNIYPHPSSVATTRALRLTYS